MLSSPRVTPQLNTDAGVCTCVSIVISVMEGRGGGLRGEQREGGKLSSRVCSALQYMFANRGVHVGTGTQPSVRDLAVWKKSMKTQSQVT